MVVGSTVSFRFYIGTVQVNSNTNAGKGQQAERGVHGEYDGEHAEVVHGNAARAEVADDAPAEDGLTRQRIRPMS
jgi:hypothetical protein